MAINLSHGLSWGPIGFCSVTSVIYLVGVPMGTVGVIIGCVRGCLEDIDDTQLFHQNWAVQFNGLASVWPYCDLNRS